MTCKPMQNNAGFALIELLVVIAIIGILASIALPQYSHYREQTKAASCLSNRRNIEVEFVSEALGRARPPLHEHEAGELLVLDAVAAVVADLWSAMQTASAWAAAAVTAPAIDPQWVCPSGGVYVWLVSDPADSNYPRIGCSIHYAGLSQEEEAAVSLFDAQFDDMDGLTPLIGRWETRDGNLVNVGRGEHRLAFGDKSWKDVEITTNATLTDGRGYAVYYRADGEKNISGYAFQFNPARTGEQIHVRKVTNGRESQPFEINNLPEDFPAYNSSHEVKISVIDDHHVIKIDGKVVLDFHDDTFSEGMAGLRTWSNNKAEFHDLSVTEK